MINMHLKAHVELDFSFLVPEKKTIERNFTTASVFQPVSLWSNYTFAQFYLILKTTLDVSGIFSVMQQFSKIKRK